ncbi:MAG: PadR family transcriptional regulator [Thermoplasmata archaeon]|nr:PadR family transcriptional regulator [Thermoplasmata archaeon]
MRRTKTVDKFLTKFDKELKSGMISLILLFMIDRARDPMYGYQIIREIKEKTDGNLEFKEGTIYPILRNLEARGLLKSVWDTKGERPRKYYQITKDGKSALSHAIDDWETFSGVIKDLISRDGGEGGP